MINEREEKNQTLRIKGNQRAFGGGVRERRGVGEKREVAMLRFGLSVVRKLKKNINGC